MGWQNEYRRWRGGDGKHEVMARHATTANLRRTNCRFNFMAANASGGSKRVLLDLQICGVTIYSQVDEEADMNLGRRALLQICAGALVMARPPFARGAAYPGRPIKVVVPTAAGGVVDLEVRRTTPLLAKALGQPVVIDNRPGPEENSCAAIDAHRGRVGIRATRGHHFRWLPRSGGN